MFSHTIWWLLKHRLNLWLQQPLHRPQQLWFSLGKNQFAIIANCVFPHNLVAAHASTQSVAATAPASTSAVVVFIGKNQLAIIANCVFPHSLVAAHASTQSVAATAPASTSAVVVFTGKKPIRHNCELCFPTQFGGCSRIDSISGCNSPRIDLSSCCCQ